MAEINPSEIITLLEERLGPRLGRFIATTLVSLSCVAAAMFLSWVIWAYGGHAIFDYIQVLLSKVATPGDLTAAVATLVWVMVAYGLALVAILYFFGRELFRRAVSQSAIDGLADLRSAAINQLFARKITEAEFDDWRSKVRAWEKALYAHMEAGFPLSDRLVVKDVGPLTGSSFSNAANGAHNNELTILAKRIKLIEDILRAYRR